MRLLRTRLLIVWLFSVCFIALGPSRRSKLYWETRVMQGGRKALSRLARLGLHVNPQWSLQAGCVNISPWSSCRASWQTFAGVQVSPCSNSRVPPAEATPTLLKTEIVNGVAVITMLAPEGNFEWGTRIMEHRINPIFVEQVNAALDMAEDSEAQAVVVIGEGKFFSNGMDLQYITANVDQATGIQAEAERLLSRLLTFRLPTVAALNGHFVAAGAMFGLAFDVRVMPADGNGLFFVPGIDIGLVYSPGMTELMKAKLPQPLWTDVVSFGKQFWCQDLVKHGVVNEAPLAADLFSKSMQLATELRAKGKDDKTRDTLHGIKKNLYKDAVAALGNNVENMGFASGTWDDTGRPSKN